jgi:UDP-galactopyranose mutase
VKPVELFQPCVQINYPNDFDYTRSFEVKHVTKQQTQNTVVGYEYPSATGEPYYPVPALENQRLLEGYQQLARAETEKNGVYFVGRLAQYRYINTDEAIEAALQMHEQIKTLVRG